MDALDAAAVLGGCCLPNAQVPQQDFIHTGNRLDLAIQGNGYFALQKPSGKRCFTRGGRFVRSPTGQVTTPDGWPVLSFGEIRIPQQATNLTITSDGNTDMIYLGHHRFTIWHETSRNTTDPPSPSPIEPFHGTLHHGWLEELGKPHPPRPWED